MHVTAFLANAHQAHTRMTAVYRDLKPYLLAGHQFVVTIKPKTRSSAQNAALHAWLTEIANTVAWAGGKRDIETWKRLLTAAWLRARGEGVEVLPALDGHGIDVVFRRTSTLTVAECSELLEYVTWWATEHGVTNNIIQQEIA